jgi:hypothetical protein
VEGRLAVGEPSSLAEPAATVFAILTLSHYSKIRGLGKPTSVFLLLPSMSYVAKSSRCVFEQYPSEHDDGFGGLASAMQGTVGFRLGSSRTSRLQVMAQARV